MALHQPAPNMRRAAILAAAARAFAAHGFRGSSLRDIAMDAGVSLALLSHHFGGKALLLDAVVALHQDACLRRLADLDASIRSPARPLDLARLVDEWVEHEFGLHRTREDKHYLRLMLKLAEDEDVAPDVRRDLNCSRAIVVQGLHLACPGASTQAIEDTWLLASHALYAALLDADEQVEDQTRTAAGLQTMTVDFLRGGIAACLQAPAPGTRP